MMHGQHFSNLVTASQTETERAQIFANLILQNPPSQPDLKGIAMIPQRSNAARASCDLAAPRCVVAGDPAEAQTAHQPRSLSQLLPCSFRSRSAAASPHDRWPRASSRAAVRDPANQFRYEVDDPTDSPPKLKPRIIASCCCCIGFLKLVLLFSTVVQCCIVVVPALQQAQVTVSE